MKRRFPSALAAAAALTLALAGFGQTSKPRDLTAGLIGHAHIDLSWLWRWEETVADVAAQTLRGTLAQMDRAPGLTFAQSQAALYEAIEKSDPALFARIRERVRKGTWIPVGGMWVEPDLNMPDGESLARQLLYGKRYFIEKFGVDVKVGWNPDTFGHSWQLPQILSLAGISSYVFGRCAPENVPAFRWQGQNGDVTLCYVPQGWYNVALSENLRDILLPAAKASPLREFMILYGAGDHGGGPRDADLAALKRLKKDKSQPKLEFVTPEGFFQRLRAAAAPLPLVARELNFTFPACYTTQSETKKANRRMEALLLAAEPFSAAAVASGFRDYYPERDLDEAWKIVLRNQFHDILDGSSIGPVYDEVLRFYGEARDRARRALDFSLETIANAVDTRGEGLPLLVFNPLGWARTDLVSVDLPGAADPAVRVIEAGGTEVPVQAVPAGGPAGRPSGRLIFTAQNVPGMGYKLYRIVRREGAPLPASPVSASTAGLENEFLQVVLNPRTGWVVRIIDKSARRDILSAPAVLEAVADEPESMSAWELGLKGRVGVVGEAGARTEVIENGPVRAVVRTAAKFRDSDFVLDVILTRGVRRVDFRLGLNWQERNVMIKAAFPLAWTPEAGDFEIPFGVIRRPADGTEVPALRWADAPAPDGGFGAALLNDCKYGYDLKGGVLRLSIVHGATSPDPEADRGPQELAFALLPHEGDWRQGGVLRAGCEFNSPLLPRVAMAHPGSLPAERAFLKAGPDNVVVSAFKKETGYYERGWIVRVYEAWGRPAEARLEFPWPVEAVETDLIERPSAKSLGSGAVLSIGLKPYEIKTLRILKK